MVDRCCARQFANGLLFAEYEQVDGKTVLRFARTLSLPGYSFSLDGPTRMVLAFGSSNSFREHDNSDKQVCGCRGSESGAMGRWCSLSPFFSCCR